MKNFLRDEDIEVWKARFIEYCDGKQKARPGMQIVKDISIAKANKGKSALGEKGITKLQDWQDDEVLFTFCTNPDLKPYLQSFCGRNIKSVHTMFINKPPNMGSSSRHPMHQDLAYFPFRPADRIVAAWTALEDASVENGALFVVPGSHKGEFLEHGYPKDTVNKAYYGILNEEGIKPRFMPMNKGDIIFFHPLLIHGSGPNKTQGYRKSLCCHFAAAECFYIDINGTYHQKLADEIMDYAERKGMITKEQVKYEDIWRMKSRVILGEASPSGI